MVESPVRLLGEADTYSGRDHRTLIQDGATDLRPLPDFNLFIDDGLLDSAAAVHHHIPSQDRPAYLCAHHGTALGHNRVHHGASVLITAENGGRIAVGGRADGPP